MGIKIGDIDIGNQLLDNEFRTRVLELVVGFNARNNRYPNETELNQIRSDVVRILQDKYPNSGIELRNQ